VVVVCQFAICGNVLIRLGKMIILQKMILKKDQDMTNEQSLEIKIAELRVLIFKNNGTPLSSFSSREKLKC